VTERVDLTSDDFEAEPWTYPGTPPPTSGLLHHGSYSPLDPRPESVDRALLAADAAAVAERYVVVAVGSNASPAVMHRKLAKDGVDATVPFVHAGVTGLRVGHSAHVSRAGFIPTAPILTPAATTSVVAVLLDHDQLTALDRTEPNYVRELVGGQACQLAMSAGESPASFNLYVSKRGVLTPPGQPPLDRMDQDDLYADLRQRCEPFSRLLADADRAAMRRFASDEHLRDRAMDAFRRGDWVAEYR
jgi:hypothetical protein